MNKGALLPLHRLSCASRLPML